MVYLSSLLFMLFYKTNNNEIHECTFFSNTQVYILLLASLRSGIILFFPL